MMSETALRDLNLLPKSERTNESSSKDILTKPYVEPRKSVVSLVEPPVKGTEDAHAGAEVAVAEVEYIESEKLDDLEDVENSLKVLLSGLEPKDWVFLCETLNNVRRLSIYHKESLQDILDNVITLVVKALKNPRSAVCKTAIMTSEDIFKAFGDRVIDSLDPMLVQLLLKSSQDKRFVCEAAEKALIALTIWVSPVLLLPKLQPYLKHRNPRIRAKASLCVSRSVPRLLMQQSGFVLPIYAINVVKVISKLVANQNSSGLLLKSGAEGIKEYGIDKLIQIASSQLSDQLPESREAARALLLDLQTAYVKSPILAPQQVIPPSDQSEQDTSSDQPQVHYSWEQFCESNLPKLSAQAVLRVTSVTREGL